MSKKSRKKSTRQKKRVNAKKQPFMLPWVWVAVVGFIVLLAALWMTSRNGDGANRPSEISVQEAYQAYQEGQFVLDVRTQAEWDEYHVESATLIPLDELPDRLNELPKDQEIVVVCHSGNRSSVAAQILRENGFQAVSVAGGLKAWRAAGYPVVP